MKDHDKLVTRLSQVLTKLNCGENLNIDELAEEFGVSRRTIQRDLNQRFSYLPLKKEGNTYKLEPYYLGKLTLKDIHNFAILSGIKGLFPSLESEFLKSLLDGAAKDAISVKGHYYEAIEDKTTTFGYLQTAIAANKTVEFSYSDKNRVCHPYKLINNKGIWYLAALEQDVIKSFSLAKISSLIVSGKTFEPQKEIINKINSDSGMWFGEEVEIKIQVSSDVARYFKRRQLLPNQVILEELDNGDLLISTKSSMPQQAMAVVRYWIPHLKILAPLNIQETLIGTIKAYMENTGLPAK